MNFLFGWLRYGWCDWCGNLFHIDTIKNSQHFHGNLAISDAGSNQNHKNCCQKNSKANRSYQALHGSEPEWSFQLLQPVVDFFSGFLLYSFNLTIQSFVKIADENFLRQNSVVVRVKLAYFVKMMKVGFVWVFFIVIFFEVFNKINFFFLVQTVRNNSDQIIFRLNKMGIDKIKLSRHVSAWRGVLLRLFPEGLYSVSVLSLGLRKYVVLLPAIILFRAGSFGCLFALRLWS